MDMERGLEHALDGNALLFAGAGLSFGAVNLKGGPFKRGSEFADFLANRAGAAPGLSLEDAAEEFAARFGQDELSKELELEFTTKQLSPAHTQLASIPWRRIYTTNYDDVLEKAIHAAGVRLKSVTLSDNIRHIPNDGLLCVHLNGFVGRLNRSSLWSEIKLTDTSYLTATVASSPWASLFRQDVELASAIFYLGYSLADLDVRRILVESPKLKEKSFFVLGAAPPAPTVHRASRFGTVEKWDTSKFAAEITEKRRTYSPAEGVEPILHCLRKFSVTPSASPLADRDVFSLLMLGDIKTEFLWGSLHGGPAYALERPSPETALTAIAAGANLVVVHSDLGNGKTVVLEELKCKAIEAGYAVYSLVEKLPSLYPEIESVLRSPERKIFVIENYPDWLDALKFVSSRIDSKSFFVLSARTSTHDILIDRLAEIMDTTEMVEVSVDRLSPGEIAWIAGLFDEYGLWGERAGWFPQQKREYLSQACRSEWQAILIRLFDSPQIRNRFSALFEDVRKQQNFHEVLISVMILTVLGKAPSLSALVDLCGAHVLEAAFRRDPAIREVVDFARGEIQLRSSVAGEFILKHVADPNSTLSILIALARAADKSADVSLYYGDICKSIARYSSLQNILPEKDRSKATLHYYESVKNLESYRSNPLFWLQYAIACLAIEEFDRAEKYFDTAYAFADKRTTYDTYQIDNHYARFLLMRSLRRGDPSTCMLDFRTARMILFEQMRHERRHYPYRVASVIGDFFAAFAPLLNAEDKNEIVNAARHISERITRLPRVRQENENVVRCGEVMQRIIDYRD